MSRPSTSWRTQLAGRPSTEWLTAAQRLTLAGESSEALALLESGHVLYPEDIGLSLALAGFYLDLQRPFDAEKLLDAILTGDPSNLVAAFMLSRVLRAQGQLSQLAHRLLTAVSLNELDSELAIQAIETLDDADCKKEAYAICERALETDSVNDARLHAYAGMLALQLGEFARARAHYEATIERAGETKAWEWHIAQGLSQCQRYTKSATSDLRRFQQALQRTDLSTTARIELLFALGKLQDDLGEPEAAAEAWREGNTLAHVNSRWSRKAWRRMINARICINPSRRRQTEPRGWAPLFVVGVPRSGTTLLAQRLAAFAGIVSRGELRWLPELSAQLRSQNKDQVELAARRYELQLRQGNFQAQWCIDKQPFNLIHVDLIMSLWPDAKIIYCVRNPRDTALSIWAQRFGDAAHDYAYDFNDIAAVIQGCHRLMSHWIAHYPESIRMISYETMVTSPDEITSLAAWLGIDSDNDSTIREDSTIISTASLWQARQPMYQSSVGRWQTYAQFIPEILRINSRY